MGFRGNVVLQSLTVCPPLDDVAVTAQTGMTGQGYAANYILVCARHVTIKYFGP